jgi:hypothetical protein
MTTSSLARSIEKPVPLKGQYPTGGSVRLRGAFLAAFGLFFLMNFVLWKFDERYDFSPGRKTMQQFDLERTVREVPAEHRFNFAGSSLIIYPLWKLDRVGKYTTCGDANHYHRSQTFAVELAKNGIRDTTNYDLAVGGAMASDVYLLAKNSIPARDNQQYLIWGCAPRDFFDNNAPTPTSTLVFRHLFPLAELFTQDGSLYEPQLVNRFNFVLNRTVFFLNHNREITQHLAETFDRWQTSAIEAAKAAGEKAMLNPAAGSNAVPRPAVPAEKAVPRPALTASSSPVQAKADLPVHALTIFDGDGLDRKKLEDNSLAEYRARYHSISIASMSRQMQFAQRLIELCKQRSIKLIVVNMPLSSKNKALLPGDTYREYCSAINSLFNSADVRYLDLSDAAEFQHTDFDDTVHLNASGGAKLFHKILPAITSTCLPESSSAR